MVQFHWADYLVFAVKLIVSVCFRSENDAVPLGRLPGVCSHRC